MKKYLDLIPISAKIHGRQSRMTHICIILAVFLVSAMFGLADMYLQGAITKQMYTSGNWHYKFTSIDRETASLISARSEVTVSGWHNTVTTNSGYSFGEQPISISGQEKAIFEDVYLGTLYEGKYPSSYNEIAVSSKLKESKELRVGGNFDLTLPDGSHVGFTITGFLDDNHTGPLISGSNLIAVLTPEGLNMLTDGASDALIQEEYVVQLSRFCHMQNAVSDIKNQLNLSSEQVIANGNLLSIIGQMEGTNINQIYYVAFILSIIVMLTCILMISSSLNSNVMQRTEFFGMMRCLGATRKQVMRFVRHEGLHWCKTAIPIGIVASIMVVWFLSAVMRRISPEWFSYMPIFGVSWISIAVGLVLGILTVILAARSPAKKAAKVSPLEAVSGNTQQIASFRKVANTRIFKIETALGVHHAKASKKNFLLMTCAFSICIALFLTFSTLIDFMENAMMPKPWTSELSIASESNTCSIEKNLLRAVNQNDKVKRAYGRMFEYHVSAVIEGKSQNTNLISYEENQFAWALDSLSEGSIESVMQEENQVLFVYNENVPVHVGDSITLSINNESRTVTIAGILSDSTLAREEGTETIICSEKTFTGLTGQSGYTIIDVQFKNSATEEDVMSIESLFTEGIVFKDEFSLVQQRRNLYYAFSILVYGFLSIIVAITIFHIMNTINMGVAAKMKQYGAMRAIGMSDRQLVKMIIAEAATYAISGIIAGCILGIPLHWVIFLSMITTFWGIPWSIPFIALGLIVGIVLITTFLAVRGPAKRIYNMSIVDNISAQ